MLGKTLNLILFLKGIGFSFLGGERWINLTKPCHLIIGPMRSPYAKYYPSVIRSRTLQKVFGGWMVGGGGGGYHSEYRVLL